MQRLYAERQGLSSSPRDALLVRLHQVLFTGGLLCVLPDDLWLQHVLKRDGLGVVTGKGGINVAGYALAHLLKFFHADSANHGREQPAT